MTGETLYMAGGAIFVLLGAVHVLYTLLDVKNPRKLVPSVPGLQEAMGESTLRLTRQTTMWRAWVGFNISHGLGAMFFGAVFILLAQAGGQVLTDMPMLQYLAVGVAAVYFALSIKYWFVIPTVGTGIGLACMSAALISGAPIHG